MISIELTELEALYAFNAIEIHQADVQDALTKLKKDISKDPSVFLDQIGSITMILNDLTPATDIQLKILPVMDLEGKQEAIEQGLEERKKWIQENTKGFKKALVAVTKEIDG